MTIGQAATAREPEGRPRPPPGPGPGWTPILDGLHRELIQLDPGYIRILEGNGHSNLRLFGTAFRATLEMVRRRERDAQPQAAHAAVAAA